MRRRYVLSSLKLGNYSGGVTPVPIPNTEVKPSSTDGTALETGWESRPLPSFVPDEPLIKRGFFLPAVFRDRCCGICINLIQSPPSQKQSAVSERQLLKVTSYLNFVAIQLYLVDEYLKSASKGANLASVLASGFGFVMKIRSPLSI